MGEGEGVGEGDGVGVGAGAKGGAGLGLDAVVDCVPAQPVRIQSESTNEIAKIFAVVMGPPGMWLVLLEKKMLLSRNAAALLR